MSSKRQFALLVTHVSEDEVHYIASAERGALTKGAEINIDGPNFVIGRDPSCHLCIEEGRNISRKHAIIHSGQEEYTLEDISRNGTLLNNQVLEKESHYPLQFNDLIQLHELVVFQFVDPEVTPVANKPVSLMGITIYPDEREVVVQGQKLEPRLARKPFMLLEILIENQEKLVSREDISDTVWPEAEGEISEEMIDNVIARLRRALRSVDKENEYIETVHGQGFIFRQPKHEMGGSG